MKTLGWEKMIRHIVLAKFQFFLTVRIDLHLQVQLQVRYLKLVRGSKSELQLAGRPDDTQFSRRFPCPYLLESSPAKCGFITESGTCRNGSLFAKHCQKQPLLTSFDLLDMFDYHF